MTEHNLPTLLFSPQAWRKMLTYVQLAPGEINGWSFVRMVSPGLLYVGDADEVFIINQTVTPGSADNSSGDVAMAMYQAMVRERGEDLRLQWHSHVHGQPVFSRTDTGTMDRQADAGSTWLVSLVLNKYGQVTARLDFYSPIRVSTDLRVCLETEIDPELVKLCAADMVEHVTLRETVPPPPSNASRGPKPGPFRYVSQTRERPLTRNDLVFKDITATPLPLGYFD